MLDRKKNDYYFNIFLNLVRALYMQLEKDWDKEARICDISYAQQHALWLLHVQDGLTLEELGNIAIWNKSTTSALVSRLEKKGLVEKRKEENSRTIRIYLTPSGVQKIKDSTNTKECIEYMSLLKDFEEEELVRMLMQIRKMVELASKTRNADFDKFIEEYSSSLLVDKE